MRRDRVPGLQVGLDADRPGTAVGGELVGLEAARRRQEVARRVLGVEPRGEVVQERVAALVQQADATVVTAPTTARFPRPARARLAGASLDDPTAVSPVLSVASPPPCPVLDALAPTPCALLVTSIELPL